MPRPGRQWTTVLCLCAMVVLAPGQAKVDEEFDNAKWRVQLNGWISEPAGYFNPSECHRFSVRTS